MIVFLLIGTINHPGFFKDIDTVNRAFLDKGDCEYHLKLFKLDMYNTYGPGSKVDVKCEKTKI